MEKIAFYNDSRDGVIVILETEGEKADECRDEYGRTYEDWPEVDADLYGKSGIIIWEGEITKGGVLHEFQGSIRDPKREEWQNLNRKDSIFGS